MGQQTHQDRDVIRLGISIGDINGIGVEIIIKTLRDARLLENVMPVIYGSQRVLNFYRKLMNDEEFAYYGARSMDDLQPRKVNVISAWTEELDIQPGQVTEAGGFSALKSLEMAVQDLANNKLDVLVTAPINKQNIQSAGFSFPGHTEYLANYAEVKEVLMLMIADKLRVGTVTGHIALNEVSAAITREAIESKLQILHKTLQQDFSIRAPKIAVLGLNPHAGDRGLFGNEEIEVIIPALEAAKEQGMLVFGPYAADGFFGSGTFAEFDAVLAMYHDQGLIPFKTLSAGGGVNYTAGLPIVRTSPAHGTAYGIAGQNVASEASFREAVYAACDIFRERKMNRTLAANALAPQKAK